MDRYLASEIDSCEFSAAMKSSINDILNKDESWQSGEDSGDVSANIRTVDLPECRLGARNEGNPDVQWCHDSQ